MVDTIVLFMAVVNARKVLFLFQAGNPYFKQVCFRRSLRRFHGDYMIFKKIKSINGYDYQRCGKYSTGWTRHNHVFVLRGCYSAPLVGGAPPTRSITRVSHR